MDGSLCVTVGCQDAEAEFLEEFLGGMRINGFELLNSSVYFSLCVAVFEVVDDRKQIVHGFSVLEWVGEKKKVEGVKQTRIFNW